MISRLLNYRNIACVAFSDKGTTIPMSRPGTGIRVRPSSRSGLISQAGPIPVTSRQSRMGTSMRTAAAVGKYL